MALITRLSDLEKHAQGFYADDATVCANFKNLIHWQQELTDTVRTRNVNDDIKY